MLMINSESTQVQCHMLCKRSVSLHSSNYIQTITNICLPCKGHKTQVCSDFVKIITFIDFLVTTRPALNFCPKVRLFIKLLTTNILMTSESF